MITSSFSAPSDIYIDIPSNLNFLDCQTDQNNDKPHKRNKSQKPNYQKNKKSCKDLKSRENSHKRQTNHQYIKVCYENHNRKK